MIKINRLFFVFFLFCLMQGCATNQREKIDGNATKKISPTKSTTTTTAIDKALKQLQQTASTTNGLSSHKFVESLDGQMFIEQLPVEQPIKGSYASAPAAPVTKAIPPEMMSQSGVYERVFTNKKLVALTFDDGPHVTNTPRLLNILKRKGVKATFFIVGQRVSYYPKIIKRIVNEGHELGNHSWEHKNFLSIGSNAVRRSLNKTHKLVLKTTGKKMKLVRPPYGAFNNRISRIAQNELGYKIIMWDVDPLDWKKPGTIKVRNRIINGAQAGSIILAHDIHTSTVNAIPTVIDRLKAKGYQFVTVSRLLRESKSGSGGSNIQVVSL